MKHGKFHYRLPAGAIGVTLPSGYTRWHLCAAGLMDPLEIWSLLQAASSVDSGTLLDDLRESMTVFDTAAASRWQWAGQYHHKIHSWEDVRCLTAWQNPLLICQVLNRSLLQELDLVSPYAVIPPVVMAAHLHTLNRRSTQ